MITPKVTRQGNATGWVMTSLAVARDGSIDPTDKALYAAIASFVDSDTRRSPQVGQGHHGMPAPDVPTRQRLAECIGRTVYTVDRATKRLEQRGVIRVHRKTDPDNPKVHLPSEYELLNYVPPAVPVVPSQSRRRKTSGQTRTRVAISPGRRQAVLARDGHRCVKCQATEDLTIDHIFPWSLGGTNAVENLRTLCRSCNSRKGAQRLSNEAHS